MKIKGKLAKIGHSYGFIVPKAYVSDGNLSLDTEYEIDIKKQE